MSSEGGDDCDKGWRRQRRRSPGEEGLTVRRPCDEGKRTMIELWRGAVDDRGVCGVDEVGS